MESNHRFRVGIIGSGFMSKGLTMALHNQDDIIVSKALTRSDPSLRTDFPLPILTNSLPDLLKHSDVIVECSGDVVYATDTVAEILDHGLPVITLDPALHITSGSYLNTLGWFSEAEGDQPGCLAALAESLTSCGFFPIVYGNIKGYQKLSPDPKHMEVWAKHLGISLHEAIANTDGTKLQIEQCLVANWFDTAIACEGMIGLDCKAIEGGAQALASYTDVIPITDYLIPQYGYPGVFILADCPDEYQHPYLRYLKLGAGPYLFSTNYHLCHLEVIKTIRRWKEGRPVLINNGLSTPSFSVAAVAKRTLSLGERVLGIGSEDVRGIIVEIKNRPNHLPIGLIHEARAKRTVDPGQILTMDDVFLPDTLALRAWSEYHANTD